MSPLDWALVESWKNAGVPLEAVMRGIDAAFEKWRARKVKTQMVNSLAFCAQAVLTEAQIMAGAGAARARRPPRRSRSTISAHTWRAMPRAVETRKSPRSPRRCATSRRGELDDLEAVEQRLTVLEEKMIATARGRAIGRGVAASPPGARPSTPALSRQDDRRPAHHAREAVPRAQSPGAVEAPAPEPLLYALKRSWPPRRRMNCLQLNRY